MATKIRLQRFGKKGRPFYHVVVADARAPRDGKFIERIGSYNPNTNPATIDLNFDKALDWVNKGAQPTDTCRAILSYKGVMYKKHLEGGVKKGALTTEQAEAKFAAWLEAKASKISGKTEGLAQAKEKAKKEALAAEAKRKAEKATAIEAKLNAPAEVEAPAAEEAPATEEVVAEEGTEVVAEAAAEETPAEAATEEVVAEVAVEEAPAAEEAPFEEAPAVEETPAAEEGAAEETPAE